MSLQDPRSWDQLLGGNLSDAGVRVTEQTMLSVPTFWNCVSTIADEIAGLPLNLHIAGKYGKESIQYANPAQKLVSREANSEMSAFVFWQQMMTTALVYGQAMAFIDRRKGDGAPIELIPLSPEFVDVRRDAGRVVYTYQSPSMPPRDMRADEVFRFGWMSLDQGVTYLKPSQMFKNALGLSMASEGFASKFFANGVRPAGILELPLGMKKATADMADEGFLKKYTGENNWFKTIILRDGAKWHSISMKPSDGEMSATRDLQALEICRFFKMPPSRVGVKGSASHASKTDDTRSYLDQCIRPWSMRIRAECYMKLLPEALKESGQYYFDHDTAALLAMNDLERAQIGTMLVRSAIISPNEARRYENLPAYDGGDEFAKLSADSPQAGGADRLPKDGSSGKKDDPGIAVKDAERSDTASSRRRVGYQILSQARDKARKGGAAWIQFVDSGLPWHVAEEQSLLGDSSITKRFLTEFQGLSNAPQTKPFLEMFEDVAKVLEELL